jgi:hypothetical protein
LSDTAALTVPGVTISAVARFPGVTSSRLNGYDGAGNDAGIGPGGTKDVIDYGSGRGLEGSSGSVTSTARVSDYGQADDRAGPRGSPTSSPTLLVTANHD